MSSASGGHKRPHSTTNDGAGPSTSTAHPSKKSKQTSTPDEPKHPDNSKPFHLEKGRVPKKAGGIKAAFYLHIRLLSRCYHRNAIPTPPTAEHKAEFSRRFNDLKSVEERSGAGPPIVEQVSSLMLDALRDLPPKGRIATNLRRIRHDIISVIFSYLANYGFTSWAPDLTETPTSMWNIACQNVALDSFKQAMASHGYAFLSPNHDYLTNRLFLTDIYNQFVWTYMKSLHELELRNAGAIASRTENSEVYRRRKELATRRSKWAREENYPKRVYEQLGDPFCTSEDEKVEENFIVRSKPGCSQLWTEFKVQVDSKILLQKQLAGQSAHAKKLQCRIRPAPGETQKSGEFLRLPNPKTATLDYFDLQQFNNLPMQVRFQYANRPIALPDNATWIFNEDNSKEGRVWKKMSDKEFMEKYGNAVVEKLGYNLPTEEDMAAADDEDEDDDEEMDQTAG